MKMIHNDIHNKYLILSLAVFLLGLTLFDGNHFHTLKTVDITLSERRE